MSELREFLLELLENAKARPFSEIMECIEPALPNTTSEEVKEELKVLTRAQQVKHQDRAGNETYWAIKH